MWNPAYWDLSEGCIPLNVSQRANKQLRTSWSCYRNKQPNSPRYDILGASLAEKRHGRLNSTQFDATTIAVYTPTSHAKLTTKDQVYNEIQNLGNCPQARHLLNSKRPERPHGINGWKYQTFWRN